MFKQDGLNHYFIQVQEEATSEATSDYNFSYSEATSLEVQTPDASDTGSSQIDEVYIISYLSINQS